MAFINTLYSKNYALRPGCVGRMLRDASVPANGAAIDPSMYLFQDLGIENIPLLSNWD
jgi:hypothetical protein